VNYCRRKQEGPRGAAQVPVSRGNCRPAELACQPGRWDGVNRWTERAGTRAFR